MTCDNCGKFAMNLMEVIHFTSGYPSIEEKQKWCLYCVNDPTRKVL